MGYMAFQQVYTNSAIQNKNDLCDCHSFAFGALGFLSCNNSQTIKWAFPFVLWDPWVTLLELSCPCSLVILPGPLGTLSHCWFRSHGNEVSLFICSNSESCHPFCQQLCSCSEFLSVLQSVSVTFAVGRVQSQCLQDSLSSPLSVEGHDSSCFFTVPGNSDRNPSPLFSSAAVSIARTVLDVHLSTPCSLVSEEQASPFHGAIARVSDFMDSAFSAPVSSLLSFSLPLAFSLSSC